MARRRIYRVLFEAFEQGQWMRNWSNRDVCVIGGAEQAIKVATQKMKADYDNKRLRAESVTLLADED